MLAALPGSTHFNAPRQIEDVDALLLLERARVKVKAEETLLQSLRGEPGLKARVGVAGEDAALVRDVVIGLREVGDLVLVLRHRLSVGWLAQGRGLAGEEGEGAPLPDEEAEDLGADLVDDLDGLGALRQRGMLRSRLRAERSSSSVLARSSFSSMGRSLWKTEVVPPCSSLGLVATLGNPAGESQITGLGARSYRKSSPDDQPARSAAPPPRAERWPLDLIESAGQDDIIVRG